jgi:hypothetical protein
MNNKKVLIISILSVLTVLMIIVGLILFSINKKEQMLIDNVDIIKSNYAKFISNTADSDDIIKELEDLMKKFDNGTYEDEHDEFVKVLKKYDENIKYVESIVKDMESRCKYKYEDAVVTLLCKGYDIIYEETINLYISNINKYNNKLTTYNKTASKTYELHKLIYTNYIDYDNDGEYEGK